MTHPCFQGLEEDLGRVRDYLASLAPAESTFVAEMAVHILRSKGQLLRPSLVLACSRIEGATDPDRRVGLASMVELIHAASLLHDDVIDQSTQRRRLQTVNALWGNKEAILLGDFLLAKALGVLARYPDARIVRTGERITHSLSVGQLVELENIGRLDLAEEAYYRIISLKTADFFRECCYLGGIAANTGESNLEILSSVGHALGMIYQILDDLLDVTAAAIAGKDTSLDLANGYITLPIIHCLRQPEVAGEIRQALEKRDREWVSHRLPSLASECGAVDACLKQAKDRAREATRQMDGLTGSGAGRVRDILSGFLRYVFQRVEGPAMERPRDRVQATSVTS